MSSDLQTFFQDVGFSALKAELWARFVEQVVSVFDQAASDLRKTSKWNEFKKKKGSLGKKRKCKDSTDLIQIPIEDALTSELGHIIRNIRRNLPQGHFLRKNEVTFDFESLVESNERAGRHSRRADFYIYAASGPNDPEIAIEAKPLVDGDDINDRYLAEDGIGCFLTDDSPYVVGPLGGMLAYTMNEDQKPFRDAIKTSVSDMQPGLLNVGDLMLSTQEAQTFYSQHSCRSSDSGKIVILHFELLFQTERVR